MIEGKQKEKQDLMSALNTAPKDELLLTMLSNNERYRQRKMEEDPSYFVRLKENYPKVLMITCVDSRMIPHLLTRTPPGKMMLFRNIANIIAASDISIVSTLHYAIDLLDVKHIIIMGHSGCAGVITSTILSYHGVIDNYLFPVKKVYHENEAELSKLPKEAMYRRLQELNVREQVSNCIRLPVVQKAWNIGKELFIHGWFFEMETGKVMDLNITKSRKEDIDEIYDFRFGPEILGASPSWKLNKRNSILYH
eukprot:TRINITY_DN3336_c0_g2_i2.p1 TRINITY_DN3336_c0_g2~~TRINITY_DN3336_c0_g2_i2.p1  ORF type:complete len:252 (+),score=58.72 TRINITY_DN3336_c0_g2_i2:54-809(+)